MCIKLILGPGSDFCYISLYVSSRPIQIPYIIKKPGMFSALRNTSEYKIMRQQSPFPGEYKATLSGLFSMLSFPSQTRVERRGCVSEFWPDLLDNFSNMAAILSMDGLKI